MKLIDEKVKQINKQSNNGKVIKKTDDFILYENGTFVVLDGVREITKSIITTDIKSKISKVILPKSVEIIGDYAFNNAHNLEEIYFNNGLRQIGKFAFGGSSLKVVDLPEGLSCIESDAFNGCEFLEKVKLPTTLKEIKNNAFHYCKSLIEINFNIGLELIGENAFYGCESLTNAVMPQSLKFLGAESFSFSGLTRVEFQDGLQKIENKVFYHCQNLEFVKLPTDLQVINSNAFAGCSSLKNIEFADSLQFLGSNAFSNCRELERVDFPDSVNIIDNQCFSNCSKLKVVTGLNNLSMGAWVFSGCSKLDKITITNCSLGSYIFNNAKINQIILDNVIFANTETYHFALSNSFGKINVKANADEVAKIDLNDFLFTQHNGDELIITNNSSNLISKLPYEFNPIINYNKLLTKSNYHYIIDMLKDYEIAMPHYVIRKCNDIHKQTKEGFNFSKFKRVYNIIEKEYFNAKSKVTLEDVEDFYILAYNLGAFSEDEELRTTVCNFLKDKLIRGEINLSEMHQDYNGMQYKGVNKAFTAFYMKNFLSLKKEGGEFICRCFNDYDLLQRLNTSNRGEQRQLKPSIDVFKKLIVELQANKFDYKNEREKEISIEISQFFTSEKCFNDACAIMRTIDAMQGNKSIICDLESIEDNAGEEFTYKWLKKDDVKNLTLGKYCNCCSHLEGMGYGIMRGAIIAPDIQNLVILKDGKIVAKSTLYINKEKCYGVFNNIEVNNVLVNEKQKADLLKCYKRGVQAFIDKYNQENPKQTLKKVNVGLHLNDLAPLLQNDKDNEMLVSVNYAKYDISRIALYQGDAMREEGQACLYNEKIKKQIFIDEITK
ncbi:MAG: leucine-rich repeat protein [Clostridia bacterium]|nr:leucine-rich repeat protein [Clostridia bacterium]